MGYFEFPHTRTYDNDLGWLIWAMKKLISDWEDFSNTNSIKFADPINWSIDRNYEPSTVVLDADGNGYIARQAVPAGVPLSNTNYWTEIFSFGDLTTKIRENIAFDEEDSPTATNAYQVGELLWWHGDLYRVIQDMWAGTAFIVGSNIEKTTVEQEIRRVVGEAQDITDDLRDNIAVNNNGSATAVQALQKGDLVWLNNNLYAAEYDIPIGTELLPGANINLKTVDGKINENAEAADEEAENIRDNIAANNNGSETAVQEYKKGDLVWFNDWLYSVSYDLPIGTQLIPGANLEPKTVDEKINDAMQAIIEGRDYINVKQFGATGDGVTDDAAAINAAVRAGNIIFFPAGTYRTTDRIQIPESHKYLLGAPGARIFGDGNHSIIAGDVYVADADDVYLHDITIDGLELYSNGPTTGSGYGISFVQHYPITRVAMYDITIKRCNIHNIGYRGINLYGGGSGTHGTHGIPVFNVEDCRIYDCGGFGICNSGISGTFNRIDIRNTGHQGGECMTIDNGCQDVRVSDSSFRYGNGGAGTVSCDESSHFSFDGCSFYQDDERPCLVANCSSGNVADMSVSNCSFFGGSHSITYGPASGESSPVAQINVTNCFMTQAAGTNLYGRNAQSRVKLSNTFIFNMTDIEIADMLHENVTMAGIKLRIPLDDYFNTGYTPYAGRNYAYISGNEGWVKLRFTPTGTRRDTDCPIQLPFRVRWDLYSWNDAGTMQTHIFPNGSITFWGTGYTGSTGEIKINIPLIV